MRYYKQFHGWPFAHVVALIFALACFALLLFFREIEALVTFVACGIAGLIAAWTLYKGRAHYLDIDNERITHQGSSQWTVLKADVLKVEPGDRGWTNDYDPFLKIHAGGKVYEIDGGFLVNQRRIKELVAAIERREWVH